MRPVLALLLRCVSQLEKTPVLSCMARSIVVPCSPMSNVRPVAFRRPRNRCRHCWLIGFGLVAFAFSSSFPAPASAAPFPPKSYLLVGNATCRAETGYDRRKPGDTAQFIVAIANARALIGWNSHKGKGDRYVFLAGTSDQSVGVNFDSTFGQSMLASRDRCDSLVMQAGSDHVDSSDRFASAQVAAFAEYPFALFFSCDSVGVRIDEIASIVQKPGSTFSVQSPCGKLVVTKNNGLQSITFAQEESDILTPSSPELKLQSATNKLFPAGLKRVFYRCDFAPPLSEHSAAPWVSTCTTENEGRDGKVFRTDFRIAVDEFSTNETRINEVIDNVLGRIPEGEMVQTGGPIDYVWKGGKVARNIDAAALQTAESLQFSSGRAVPLWRTLIVVNFVAASLVIAFFLVKRWRSQQ
jgi:hypothetical protein